MIKGALFDYDGTLAKTMYHHYFAWKQTLKHYIKILPEGTDWNKLLNSKA